jgi:hypothetical protein
MRNVIHAELPGHSERPLYLNMLANWPARRHTDYGLSEDLAEATKMLRFTVDSITTGNPHRPQDASTILEQDSMSGGPRRTKSDFWMRLFRPGGRP